MHDVFHPSLRFYWNIQFFRFQVISFKSGSRKICSFLIKEPLIQYFKTGRKTVVFGPIKNILNVKFVYSVKTIKFEKSPNSIRNYLVTSKQFRRFFEVFVAFSEYMNFLRKLVPYFTGNNAYMVFCSHALCCQKQLSIGPQRWD